MAANKTARERVIEKFDLAKDIKKSKIKVSLYRAEPIDGKIKADFEISGLPGKKALNGSITSYEDTHKSIPKIFNSADEFAEYVKDFFNMTDEEIIKLCKEN